MCQLNRCYCANKSLNCSMGTSEESERERKKVFKGYHRSSLQSKRWAVSHSKKKMNEQHKKWTIRSTCYGNWVIKTFVCTISAILSVYTAREREREKYSSYQNVYFGFHACVRACLAFGRLSFWFMYFKRIWPTLTTATKKKSA